MISTRHQAGRLERNPGAPSDRSPSAARSGPARMASCRRTLAVLAGVMGLFAMAAATAGAQGAQGVCGRTPQVRDQLAAAARVSACGEVTAAHLAELTRLSLIDQEIDTLRAGDFNGLTSLQELDLRDNRLSLLPAGIFDELDSLRLLDLRANRLARLSPGVFDAVLDTLGGSYMDGFRTRQGALHLDADLKAQVTFASSRKSGSEGEAVEVMAHLSRKLPVAVRVPYSVSGTATADDYWNLLPAPSEGLLFAAGETSKPVTVNLAKNDDFWQDTLVLTLGAVSEIVLLRSDGAGSQVPHLKAEAFLAPSGRHPVHTLTIAGAGPDSGLGRFCTRTQQVQDGLIAVLGVSSCGDVTAEHLATVTHLDLSQTDIEALDPHDFRGLTVLWNLDLSGNRLAELPEDVFRPLTGLQVLDLGFNELTGLPEGVFQGLEHLQSLNLRFNRLASLPEDVFRGLGSLEVLQMGSNFLTGLPEDVFKGLDSLRHLYLWSNELARLPAKVFADLAKLEVLWLKDNELTELPGGIFDGLTELRWLNLLANKLTSLPAGIFDKALKTLGDTYVLRGELRRGELLLDPEVKPTLAFASPWQNAGRGDTVSVAVTLSRPLPVAVRVPYSVGGTAAAGDYKGLRPARDFGVLFPAGETSKEIAFDLPPDRAGPERTVTLTLSQLSGVGVRLSDGSAPDPRYRDARYLRGDSFLVRPDEGATHTVVIRAPGDGPDEPEPEPAEVLFVPVILSSAGRNDAYFTSELTLTNPGAEPAALNYRYTAHLGGGSGATSDTLGAGRQKIEPDAMGYLRSLGLPVPASGNRIGTLRVEVAGASGVGVTVRTTTTVPEGRAGLAYPAVVAGDGFHEAVYLCGLRQNARDRSNLALQNLGASEAGAITLRATLFSGDPDRPETRVLEEVTLGPGGFHQYSGLLGSLESAVGDRQGYVKVERVAGSAPFYAYGVINDQANSDGSFVFPVAAGSLAGAMGQTLPVIVETGVFSSELTVANFSDVARTVTFRFKADAVQAPDRTAALEWTFRPGQQVIIPELVDRMRQSGAAGIGPAGPTFAGALFATAAEGDMSGIVIGARTGSPGGGGRYGVFYNAVPYGKSFVETAWVEALQQNRENRSNLALVNTGEVDDSASLFQLDIYDGATGTLANTLTGLRVEAGGWRQLNNLLGDYAPGVTQGYVRVRKTEGANPFLAYGIVNDGGAPGQRSGDGAYLPARERSPAD